MSAENKDTKRTVVDVLSDLAAPVPPGAIKELPQAGKPKYIEIDYIQDRLDRVFGANNWSVIEAKNELSIPPFPCTKNTQFKTGTYHPLTNKKFDKDEYVRLDGFGFNVTSTVTLQVRFPDGSIVQRANTGSAGGWFDAFSNKHPGEFKRVYGFATTNALKRCAESLGVTFGRGMTEKGTVSPEYLIDDETIQLNVDSYEHLTQPANPVRQIQDTVEQAVSRPPAPVEVSSGLTKAPAPLPVASNDGGIDMDMTIGRASDAPAHHAASAAPAAQQGLSEEQRKRVAACKAFMVAPGKLETVEDWKTVFRSMVDILAKMERSTELDMLQEQVDDWKQKASDYGVFNDQRLRDSLGTFFKAFNERILNRRALLTDNEAAAA